MSTDDVPRRLTDALRMYLPQSQAFIVAAFGTELLDAWNRAQASGRLATADNVITFLCDTVGQLSNEHDASLTEPGSNFRLTATALLQRTVDQVNYAQLRYTLAHLRTENSYFHDSDCNSDSDE